MTTVCAGVGAVVVEVVAVVHVSGGYREHSHSYIVHRSVNPTEV